MKSNFSMNGLIDNIKKAIRRFMYDDEKIIEELEEVVKYRTKKEKQVRAIKAFLFVLVIILIITAAVLSTKSIVNKEKNLDRYKGEYLDSELEGSEKAQIQTVPLECYMKDTNTNTNVNISKVKIGDSVAYSLSYNNNDIPTGEMISSKYFFNGEVASLLFYGYPNKSYDEMELLNDDEAYIATQLAIYELEEQDNYSMKNRNIFTK